MILSNLDHIQTINNEAEGKELIGGSYYSDYRSVSRYTNVRIDDNLALADASSSAYGRDTFTNAYARTSTDNYYSSSTASATSATDDYDYYYYRGY